LVEILLLFDLEEGMNSKSVTFAGKRAYIGIDVHREFFVRPQQQIVVEQAAQDESNREEVSDQG